MGKIILRYIFLLLGFYPCYSQNMIPNGDFENMISCPEGKSHLAATSDWLSPNGGNPDYFHECYNSINPLIMQREGAGVPISYMGVSSTHGGQGMAGLYLHKVENGLVPWKEYLQIKLNTKVKKNRNYCFKGFVKLSSNSNYANRNFEVFFSKGKFGEEHAFTLRKTAQLKLDSGNYLSRKDDWMEICLPYPAQKSSKYLTIGNFQPVDFTDNLVVSPRDFKERENFAYYFIDDISLTEVSNIQECLCENSFDYRTYEEANADSFSLPINKPVIFENLDFEVDSSHFEVTQEDQINNILTILKENETFYLSLVGYTDDTGDKKHNFELSLERAESVKDYFLERGISEERVFCNGLGDAFPLASNADLSGRSHNRRVEFTILKRISNK